MKNANFLKYWWEWSEVSAEFLLLAATRNRFEECFYAYFYCNYVLFLRNPCQYSSCLLYQILMNVRIRFLLMFDFSYILYLKGPSYYSSRLLYLLKKYLKYLFCLNLVCLICCLILYGDPNLFSYFVRQMLSLTYFWLIFYLKPFWLLQYCNQLWSLLLELIFMCWLFYVPNLYIVCIWKF